MRHNARLALILCLMCARVTCESLSRDQACLAAHRDGADVLVPSPIEYRPRLPLQEYKGAIESCGTVLEEGDQFLPKAMDETANIYLIARFRGKRYTVWSPRELVNPPANGQPAEGEEAKYLATHDSLTAALRAHINNGLPPEERTAFPDVEVLGAGQFYMFNHQCAEVDNGAGTRPNDGEHLDYAVDVLRSQGLPITARDAPVATKRTNFAAPGARPHRAYENAEAIAHLRVQQRREQRPTETFGELVKTWHHVLYEKYPALHSTKIPGHLDIYKLTEAGEHFPDKMLENERARIRKGLLIYAEAMHAYQDGMLPIAMDEIITQGKHGTNASGLMREAQNYLFKYFQDYPPR